MGLIQRLFKKVKMPRFSVVVYGKLPCHKEYLQVGSSPEFAALKSVLDRGFEKRISAHHPPPHVLPDRRFFVAGLGRSDLAGCIFESHDGIRAFPFMIAAPLPPKLRRSSFPVMWQCLERVWDYLEAYFMDLRDQPGKTAFYGRIRGIVHELDPFVPEPWPEPQGSLGLEKGIAEDECHLYCVDLPRTSFGVYDLGIIEEPAFILWPAGHWQNQVKGTVRAYFGRSGLSDIRVSLFRQHLENEQVGRPEAVEVQDPKGSSERLPSGTVNLKAPTPGNTQSPVFEGVKVEETTPGAEERVKPNGALKPPPCLQEPAVEDPGSAVSEDEIRVEEVGAPVSDSPGDLDSELSTAQTLGEPGAEEPLIFPDPHTSAVAQPESMQVKLPLEVDSSDISGSLAEAEEAILSEDFLGKEDPEPATAKDDQKEPGSDPLIAPPLPLRKPEEP